MEIIPADTIILHCTASQPDPKIGAATIRQWHRDRGWSDIGYHYVIRVDGVIEPGRPLTRTGSHTKGHNHQIGVVYVGGVDPKGKPKDTMNPAQQASFTALVHTLRHAFLKHFAVAGHNDYTDAKACPSFKVSAKFPHLISNP